MTDEEMAKEYAKGTAMYYESAHGSVPSQFEKYMRKAVIFGYNKAKEEDEKKQVGMTILPTVQFKRMDWNEDKLWSLIKRLKNDERTKDLFEFSEDKFGRFDFIFTKETE